MEKECQQRTKAGNCKACSGNKVPANRGLMLRGGEGSDFGGAEVKLSLHILTEVLMNESF